MRFNRLLITIPFITMLVATHLGAGTCFAATDGHLGTFGNWNAWQSATGNQPVCYMSLKLVAAPKDKTKGQPKRGMPYLMITHRPAEGSTDVVSFMAGYNFAPESSATATIAKQKFDLFTDKDTAWARDPKTDHALAKAIRGEGMFMITSTPAGKAAKPITDTVSTKGANAAYTAISKACNVTIEAMPKPAPQASKKVKKAAPKPPTTVKTHKK